jgi:hypothetical protein
VRPFASLLQLILQSVSQLILPLVLLLSLRLQLVSAVSIVAEPRHHGGSPRIHSGGGALKRSEKPSPQTMRFSAGHFGCQYRAVVELLCQGMTLAMPQAPQNYPGFSR